MIRVKKILYPTDFSSYSTHAYFHAVGLAEAFGAELTLLFAYTAAADDPHRGRCRGSPVPPSGNGQVKQEPTRTP